MKVSFSKYDATAGEDLGNRKVIYISGSANTVRLAKADSENTVPAIGFTDNSALDGETVRIYTNDVLDGFIGLIPGDSYYLSQTTAGEITNVKPSSGIVIRVGVAKSSTELDIHILRLVTSGSGGQKVQSMMLSTVNYPYLETAGTSYSVVSQFIFLGTTKMETPLKIKSITWRSGGDSVDIRIYDVTNSQVICEKTGITDLVAVVHDLGILSNLPSGEAVFEIQHKAIGSACKCRSSNVSIEW